jgi:glycosyltransferase involved in cell wall biosynthesis
MHTRSSAAAATARVRIPEPPPAPAAKTGEPRELVVSIIVPVYNELQYVGQVLERVQKAQLPPNVKKQIIVVDDGSTDGTTDLLKDLDRDDTLRIHHSVLNFGKGTAIRIGLRHATGDIIVVQDGDLEYDPNEYGNLLAPILRGEADVVYGSRFLGKPTGMRWQNYYANKLLTGLCNLLYGARITDEATAYKVFRREVIKDLELKCKRFEFCPEVTAKLSRSGVRIHEVPITYCGRSAAEGKKIGLRDGLQAMWVLVRYRFARTRPRVASASS